MLIYRLGAYFVKQFPQSDEMGACQTLDSSNKIECSLEKRGYFQYDYGVPCPYDPGMPIVAPGYLEDVWRELMSMVTTCPDLEFKERRGLTHGIDLVAQALLHSYSQ